MVVYNMLIQPDNFIGCLKKKIVYRSVFKDNKKEFARPLSNCSGNHALDSVRRDSILIFCEPIKKSIRKKLILPRHCEERSEEAIQSFSAAS